MHCSVVLRCLAWTRISLNVAGLAIRNDDHATDLFKADNTLWPTENLTADGFSVGTTNSSQAQPIEEDVPEDFGIEVRPKSGGKLFHDKYDVYKVIIDCAAYAGLHAWGATKEAFNCDQSATLRLAFTGNKPPQPQLEIRSILWSIGVLLEWYIKADKSGLPRWQEVAFLIWWDEQTRLGIGQAIAKPTLSDSRSQSRNSSLEAGETLTTTTITTTKIPPTDPNLDLEQIADNTNTSLALPIDSDLPHSLQVAEAELDVSIDIGWPKKARLVCDDALFYRVVLKMILVLAQHDADFAIREGRVKYDPKDDLSFGVQVTSVKAAEQQLLKVWIVMRALQQLAYAMATEDKKWRFKEFEAKILTGPKGRAPSRIVGKIFLLKGQPKGVGGGNMTVGIGHGDGVEDSGQESSGSVVFS